MRISRKNRVKSGVAPARPLVKRHGSRNRVRAIGRGLPKFRRAFADPSPQMWRFGADRRMLGRNEQVMKRGRI